MERLGDRWGVLHSTWLASSISCCFPGLQDQPAASKPEPKPAASGMQLQDIVSPLNIADDETATGIESNICYQQPLPRPLPALPAFDFDEPCERSRSTHRPSQWLVGGLTMASRTSSRASSVPRRGSSRRPTIGNPYDFRRAESPPLRRTPAFRPLQLSIYLPGNELPELPRFVEDEDEEDGAGLAKPVPALVKSRSDPILSRQSTSFSIRRKPVASRTSSLDAPRFSMDSGLTLIDSIPRSRSRSVDQLRSGGKDRRPSIATSQSARDFLDVLNAPLPPLPRLPQATHHPDTGPETSYSLYRRASDQSLRLRAHLEERQQIERRLPECDTIMEERSPISPLSSPFHRDASIEEDRQIHIQHSLQQQDWFQPASHPEHRTVPLPARTSSGNSTLLNPPTPTLMSIFPAPNTRPTVTTTISVPSSQPTIRRRLSAWLAKSLSTVTTAPEHHPPAHHQQHLRSPSGLSTSSISAPIELTSAWATPSANQRPRAHTKGSSVSTYVTSRGLSLDLEKHPVPIVRDVGVAF